MEELKSIITEMGYEVKNGIGSEQEIFAHDGNGNSIAIVLTGNKVSAVSNRDIETQDYPEYFEAELSDKDSVIVAASYAMSKDESLVA